MRAVAVVGVFVAMMSTGCQQKAAEEAKRAAERKPEDGVAVKEVVDLYRANPAKALAAYEDKFTKMTGVIPISISPSPIRTKVFDVRCSLDGAGGSYDFLIFCLKDEAKDFEVGKPLTLELSLFNQAQALSQPAFYTRGRAEGDAGEKRPD